MALKEFEASALRMYPARGPDSCWSRCSLAWKGKGTGGGAFGGMKSRRRFGGALEPLDLRPSVLPRIANGRSWCGLDSCEVWNRPLVFEVSYAAGGCARSCGGVVG